MVEEGHAAIARGHSANGIVQGMEKAVQVALASLLSQARPLLADDFLSVASTAASDDQKIATAIAEALKGAGKDGIVTVETGDVRDPSVTLTEGMRFERGYLSDKFVTNPEVGECILDNCHILIYDRRISTMMEFLPLLEQAARLGEPLLVIADDVDGEALATLVVNKVRGTLQCAAVKAPGTAVRRTELLHDMAVLTGGKVAAGEIGIGLSGVSVSDLGTADKVVLTRESTTILGGHGDPESIESHVNLLRSEIARAVHPLEREKLQERLTSFAGRIATIHVGGSAPQDVDEQRYRAESAMHSTRSAIQEGWICGGGIGLINARNAVMALSLDSEARKTGADVIARALERPFNTLAESARTSPVQVLSERQKSRNENVGLDVRSGRPEDLTTSGVLDSAGMVRKALEVAFSYARLILRTDVWSVSEEEEGGNR
jgi:chaperonin GroEL